jgi:pimeloyl-ACP methyl ester carboxylesterase
MSARLALAAIALATGAAAQEPTAGVAIAPDGIHIAYETLGDGPVAVVLVHGWSCDRSYWRLQLAPLARHYRVVALDLAGHGESGLGRARWTQAAFGGDVAAVVQALGLRRVVLVGHSMGGDVIAEAARRLQGRVAGLVMVDTYKRLGAGRSAEEVAAFQARMRDHFADSARAFVRTMFVPTSDRALVERVADDMASSQPDVALAALESAMSYSREMPRTLQALRLPVIAINPDNAPSDSASLKRYGVDLVVMPGVGHFPMLEDAERFNALLLAAVERLAR